MDIANTKTTSRKGLLHLVVNYYSTSFTIVTFMTSFFMTFFMGHAFLESFLFSVLLINIGIRGIIAAIGNWIPAFAEDIADQYGWEKKNTYQKEIAAGDAAFAILGLLAYWIRGDFWTAAIIGSSVCWLLSEYANILSIVRGRINPAKKLHQDYEVSGPVFFGMQLDVAMVIFTLVILVIWKMNA